MIGKYKFLEITTIYDEYATKILYDGLSYKEIMDIVRNDCYCESDYVHRYIAEMYGVETQIVYYNFSRLQEKWDTDEDKAPFSILLRQIKTFCPSVILVSDVFALSKEQLQIIKEALKERVHFICYHFTSINDVVKERLALYELCLTGNNVWVEKMSKYSSNVKLLRHAFEKSVLSKLPPTDTINKIGFVGSIMTGTKSHTNRLDLLAALKARGVDFDFYGKIYGSLVNPWNLADHIIHEPLKLPKRLSTINYLNKVCKPSCFGIEYYQILKKYAININIHAEMIGNGAGNMRMFEVTGVGSCLITDYREENKLLFEENKEIVVYRNNEELVEKARFLLSHPDVAKKIAENGQKRTLNEYTYKKKAILMNEYIMDII